MSCACGKSARWSVVHPVTGECLLFSEEEGCRVFKNHYGARNSAVAAGYGPGEYGVIRTQS